MRTSRNNLRRRGISCVSCRGCPPEPVLLDNVSPHLIQSVRRRTGTVWPELISPTHDDSTTNSVAATPRNGPSERSRFPGTFDGFSPGVRITNTGGDHFPRKRRRIWIGTRRQTQRGLQLVGPIFLPVADDLPLQREQQDGMAVLDMVGRTQVEFGESVDGQRSGGFIRKSEASRDVPDRG